MKTVSALAVALAAIAVSANPSPAQVEANATPVRRGSSLPTVTTSGNAFYAGDERFYIKGIDYQPGGSSQLQDPLADTSICGRDIPVFQKLGLNTVRVYAVDNSANHDECMQMLADAGIYLALDVNTPLYSINQDQPLKSYNAYYLQNVFATVDAFATYDNLLLFTSGNEVINAANNTNAAPFVKATTRDMKQYIGERGYRNIPVGYSAADVVPEQYTLAQYFACGEKDTQADFYGINNYEWCDPSSITISGWNVLAQQYSNFSIPIFLSEYGCVTNTRTFQETPVLYTEQMTVAISGGMVYEYAEQGNGFGIVTINGDSVTPVGNQVQYLEAAMAKIQTPSGNGGAVTTNGDQPCPNQVEGYWDTKPFTGSALPALPSGASYFMQHGAGQGVGFKGKGSQWETGGSSHTAGVSAGAVTATYGNGQPSGTGSSSSGSSSGSSSHSGASRADFAPLLACGAIVVVSFLFGAVALN